MIKSSSQGVVILLAEESVGFLEDGVTGSLLKAPNAAHGGKGSTNLRARASLSNSRKKPKCLHLGAVFGHPSRCLVLSEIPWVSKDLYTELLDTKWHLHGVCMLLAQQQVMLHSISDA